MQKQVLTFTPDGEIEYTRNTQFKPFGGAGVMKRVTDIQKLPDRDSYYIRWMLGPFAGSDHCHAFAWEYNVDTDGLLPVAMSGLSTILFETYEAAVAHEVTVLNAMRKAGVIFDEQQTDA